MNQENKQEGQEEQDKSHCPQRRTVFAAFHSPAHISGNSRRQGAGRQEQRRRKDLHLADNHRNS